jgi:hypothetical protein
MKLSADKSKMTNPGLIGIDRCIAEKDGKSYLKDYLYNMLEAQYAPKGEVVLKQIFSGGVLLDSAEDLITKRNRSILSRNLMHLMPQTTQMDVNLEKIKQSIIESVN